MKSEPIDPMVDVIIRHPRERKSKCSLEPLRGRGDLLFLTASPQLCFDATGYILLDPSAPCLSTADQQLPLLLLDSTWKLLPALLKCVSGEPLRRALPPSIRTAYPRVSKHGTDPANGLASVEALFAARYIQRRCVQGMLLHYYWREAFLKAFNS
jgi:pre-rRNA-processing protein TSR3